MISKIDKNKVRLKDMLVFVLTYQVQLKATFKRISFKQAYLRSNY